MAGANQPQNFATRTRGYVILIVANLLLISIGAYYGNSFITIALGGVAIVNFFGTLALLTKATGCGDMNNGEIRKALTTSFLTVYLTFVAFAFVDHIRFVMEQNFSELVGAILLFYFGSSSYRDYLNAKGGKFNVTPAQPGPTPDDSQN